MTEEKTPIKVTDLKDIDRTILYELIKDARENLSDIAEKNQTTEENISQNTKELKNLLDFSFSIDLDLQQFDEFKVKAYVMFKEDPNPDIRRENARIISNIPQVSHFSRVFGKYSSVVQIYARDISELSRVVSQIHEKTKQTGTETFIVHSTIKNDDKSPIKHLLKLKTNK